MKRKETQETYTRFSKHILGPTTLAAPLLILKAKKLSGQGLLRPHLVLTTAVEGTDQPLVEAAGEGAREESGERPAGEQAQQARGRWGGRLSRRGAGGGGRLSRRGAGAGGRLRT